MADESVRAGIEARLQRLCGLPLPASAGEGEGASAGASASAGTSDHHCSFHHVFFHHAFFHHIFDLIYSISYTLEHKLCAIASYASSLTSTHIRSFTLFDTTGTGEGAEGQQSSSSSSSSSALPDVSPTRPLLGKVIDLNLNSYVVNDKLCVAVYNTRMPL